MVEIVEETTVTEPVQTELPIEADKDELLAKAKKQELELRREMEHMKAELERSKKETLRKQSSYKELAEQLEKELELEKNKTKQYSEAYLYDRKLDAAKTAAAQSGMRKDAIDDIEAFLSRATEIEVETTSTGRINVLGADRFISRLKSQKPYLFETRGSKVNPETPSVNGGTDITYEKLQELKVKASKSNNPKSAEWQAYKKAIEEFAKSN